MLGRYTDIYLSPTSHGGPCGTTGVAVAPVSISCQPLPGPAGLPISGASPEAEVAMRWCREGWCCYQAKAGGVGGNPCYHGEVTPLL